METQYKACEAYPLYLQRWWLKTRATNDGMNEIYCPWYAKPLDVLHSIVFRSSYINY